MIRNDEQERIYEEEVVSCLKILFRNSREIGDNHEESQSR